MKQRCTNPKAPNYIWYGFRGINYDPSWEKYDNFLKDMGHKPPGTSLDRIDPDKGYYKENCRWATDYEQAHNRRNNVRFDVDGEDRTIAGWAQKMNMHPGNIARRLYAGWKPIDIVSTPITPHSREIEKVTLEGIVLCRFDSLAAAGRSIGRDQRHIWHILKKKGGRDGDVIWRYAE